MTQKPRRIDLRPSATSMIDFLFLLVLILVMLANEPKDESARDFVHVESPTDASQVELDDSWPKLLVADDGNFATLDGEPVGSLTELEALLKRHSFAAGAVFLFEVHANRKNGDTFAIRNLLLGKGISIAMRKPPDPNAQSLDQ